MKITYSIFRLDILNTEDYNEYKLTEINHSFDNKQSAIDYLKINILNNQDNSEYIILEVYSN